VDIGGNTILITGGGSGIGRGLAREFAKLGNTVIVAGRRLAALEEAIAGHSGMFAVPLDIMDPEGIVAFARRIRAEHPALNVLVNNAGTMTYEEKFDLAAAEAMIATNLLGTMRLTSALLPHLASRRPSTIVNVTSSLAFVPHVLSPTYSATKAALHSWSMTMREQLRPSGVEVIELIPPAVQTGLVPGLETGSKDQKSA
jgi:uncharacterized oxidoreductase